jgi:hypothetical protein
LFAFSGIRDHDQARQDLCERYATYYGEDWWFLSNHGWSLTENGHVAKGRAITERAFGLRRNNAYAAHALLHAMFEDGSVAEADELVTQWIGGYDRSGILYGHIYWHQALGALEVGDASRALAIYADVLKPSVTTAPPLNAMSDCASLLWRLLAYGHPVPADLWADADAYAKNFFPEIDAALCRSAHGAARGCDGRSGRACRAAARDRATPGRRKISCRPYRAQDRSGDECLRQQRLYGLHATARRRAR